MAHSPPRPGTALCPGRTPLTHKPPLKARGPLTDNRKRSSESAQAGIFRSRIIQYIYSIFANAVEVAVYALGAAVMIYAVSAIG